MAYLFLEAHSAGVDIQHELVVTGGKWMRADALSPGLRLMAPAFEEMAASIYLADIRGSEGTVGKRVQKPILFLLLT